VATRGLAHLEQLVIAVQVQIGMDLLDERHQLLHATHRYASPPAGAGRPASAVASPPPNWARRASTSSWLMVPRTCTVARCCAPVSTSRAVTFKIPSVSI